jgi:hypothetical protein
MPYDSIRNVRLAGTLEADQVSRLEAPPSVVRVQAILTDLPLAIHLFLRKSSVACIDGLLQD